MGRLLGAKGVGSAGGELGRAQGEEGLGRLCCFLFLSKPDGECVKLHSHPLRAGMRLETMTKNSLFLGIFSQAFPYLRGGGQLCNNQMEILAVYVVFDSSCSHLPCMV